MKILPAQIYSSSTNSQNRTSFGCAQEMTLEFILKNRAHLLPARMIAEARKAIAQGREITLRELHKEVYAPLEKCKTLDEARNTFIEFREALDLTQILNRSSRNTRAIQEKVSLGDFSLYYLKNRWCNLKTIDQIAQELGMNSRSKLQWFLDKAKLPELGKNYQTLLKSSDAEINKLMAQKAKAANNFGIIGRNAELNEIAWSKVPEMRRQIAEQKGASKGFWTPENIEKWAEARRKAWEELKSEASAN